MKRISIAAGLLLLAACGGGGATPAEFFDVARQSLRFAEADARRSQPGRPSDGPLYVNLHSFRSAAHRVTGESISEDSMSRALGEPTQALPEQVLLCDTATGFGGCWVRKYGVWVNMNLVRQAGDQMTAFVRTSSTDRSVVPSAWCNRVWELAFRRQEGGAWRMTGQQLRRDCTQEAE